MRSVRYDFLPIAKLESLHGQDMPMTERCFNDAAKLLFSYLCRLHHAKEDDRFAKFSTHDLPVKTKVLR